MSARPLVMKFGGTSVATPERLARVVEIVADARAQGAVAVVVSAMGDTTDRLIDAVEAAARGDAAQAEALVDGMADLAVQCAMGALATLEAPTDGVHATVRGLLRPLREVLHGVGLLRERTPQTLDLVLSFGERLSATVLAQVLNARGVPAVYVDARDWTVTDARFTHALVDWPATQAALDALRPGWGDRVPVVTGFLGRTPDGRTTTLGRNGSDYTATLLARGLNAYEACRWTDVSGVMTADPRRVPEAYPLARMTFMEALELANFGAKMFHPRTMIPLIESGIPMRIRNTLRPADPGTVVDATGGDDEGRPTCVTSLEHLALVDLQWRKVNQRAQLADRVLGALDRAGVPVWMFNQAAHGQAMAVVVDADRLPQVQALLQAELAGELARHEVQPLRVQAPVTLLTLVAEAMGRTVGVAGRLFAVLGRVGVLIRAIAQGASERSISCVIDAADTAVAVRTVHDAFNLAHQKVSLVLLGKGTVGGELLRQIAQQAATLEAEHDLQIRVVAVGDRLGWAFAEDGLPLPAVDAPRTPWAEGPPGDGAVPADLGRLFEQVRRLPVPILVDCTAAGGLAPTYLAAFEHGLHVVAANKKPLTGPAAEHAALVAAARRHSRGFARETTCGASLPVIETLRDLVRTGDTVRRVEGSLSGTLGYLCNRLMAGAPLSAAVREARDRGYTEPHPGDDLTGLDVARKALILARELGLPCELADVQIEPLVPAEVLAQPDLEGFFAALAAQDGAMAARVADAKAAGLTLRYLATLEPGAAQPLRVGPVAVPADHPATALQGAEAFVAFTTARYQPRPLLVQGAGAGGAVTAAGVLADVIRVANGVRGRG